MNRERLCAENQELKLFPLRGFLPYGTLRTDDVEDTTLRTATLRTGDVEDRQRWGQATLRTGDLEDKFIPQYISQPWARRAHRNPPTYIYSQMLAAYIKYVHSPNRNPQNYIFSPNVGSIYPIKHSSPKCWHHISNIFSNVGSIYPIKYVHSPSVGIIYPIFLTIFENFNNFANFETLKITYFLQMLAAYIQ